jgi:hypothetical protein
MIRAGVDTGLVDEVRWWRTDDLWFWGLEALVTYVRAAVERTAERRTRAVRSVSRSLTGWLAKCLPPKLVSAGCRSKSSPSHVLRAGAFQRLDSSRNRDRVFGGAPALPELLSHDGRWTAAAGTHVDVGRLEGPGPQRSLLFDGPMTR